MPHATHVAIFLCAGYGTRMGALTRETPKPLLPVAGRPLLDHLTKQASELPGISTLHVVTNHRYARKFREWALSWRAEFESRGQTLEIHDDGSTDNSNRLGGAGDLGFVLSRIELPETALVAGADNIFRFALEPLWRQFSSSEDNYVLGVKESSVDALRKSGVLDLDGDRVLRVHEKPVDPPSSWSCPSLYCLKRTALRRVNEYLAAGESADDLGLLVNYLIQRETFRAFSVEGARLHVGSPEMLAEADRILREEPVVL